ncbi:MAG: glycosyltransferase family 4 protein [Deltaproteobacteria bacterium]|nr:glycosyltransferase family 4 protein [Deltaproteobacteria bacterium]
MRIAFFASSVVPFHAKTLEERPLGGTETGVIRLSEALAELGHDVTVFTPMEEIPSAFSASNPKYLPQNQIEKSGPFDIFVAVRDWIPTLYNVPARKRMMWTGDSYDQFSNFGLGDKRVAERIDTLLTVGTWQADEMCRRSGFPREKAWVLGNGIHPAFFEGSETRQRKRMIYSSTPHRGLSFVPDFFSEVKKKHPDAEIHIFSSYQVYDQQRNRDFELLEESLKKTSGVVMRGSVKQSELAREFMKSSVLFYPCDFEETSCITAMEAQAAGCVVLSSALAALPETVGDAGILIEGRPRSPHYKQQYVDACDRLLSDDTLFEKLSTRGKERAKDFSWAKTAKRFMDTHQ